VRERALAVVAGALLACLVSGCDTHQFRSDAKNALFVLMGRVPQSQKVQKLTDAQQKLFENTQLLREMFEVVLLREPYGAEEFGAYVNTLSQGGSLEGIYNGFVNSEQYHKLEQTPAPAYPATVKVFSQLIAPLQQELSKSKVRPSDLDVAAPYDVASYEKVYAKASFFELKRILGNEALKVVEAKWGKGDSREELAQWYSNWVAQVSTMNVDFGFALRNRADPSFHREWVKSLKADVASDRVIWEVLNRIHRILNAIEANAEKKKGNS
jgi:hypothetical protein